jgi:hypothetical protein
MFLHMQEQVSSSIKSEVKAVGHRVVHGLDISQPVMLTPPVVDKIKAAAGTSNSKHYVHSGAHHLQTHRMQVTVRVTVLMQNMCFEEEWLQGRHLMRSVCGSFGVAKPERMHTTQYFDPVLFPALQSWLPYTTRPPCKVSLLLRRCLGQVHHRSDEG